MAGILPGGGGGANKLKLNSYDLGFSIDSTILLSSHSRSSIRNPRSVVIAPRTAILSFCVRLQHLQMLGLSSHAWKVYFCKFTTPPNANTGIEDRPRPLRLLKFLAALNVTCWRERLRPPLAATKLFLTTNSLFRVSLPNFPLLGVLPHGGLTRRSPRQTQRSAAIMPTSFLQPLTDWRSRPARQRRLALGRRES